jgi:hypothetical protein
MRKIVLSALLPLAIFANGFNADVQKYIDGLKIEAKKIDPNFTDFDIARGEKIFTTKHIGKKGKEISCVSCHSTDLRSKARNYFTNKVIKPLSPKANPKRLTKVKNIKKWLRRNFKDVYVREGNAIEKGDVLYYISSK